MANWRSYIDPSVGDGQNTIDGIIANGATYGLQISDDLSVTGLSTFSDVARFSSTIRLDGQLRDGDNNFGSSGQVLSSDGTDTRWINAGSLSAGAASQVAINDDSNTNAERFITIVDSASGNNTVKTDASLKYNPSTNTITTVNITGNVTGNVTGNASGSSGSCTGNAASATVLQNTRTIGGVSFNGSSNINLPGVNQAGNQNTSGNAGSATILANTRTIGGVSFNGSANINLPGVNQAGNQNTSGNAATATVLETTRNFSISGEITANAQSFNGSGNVILSATVDDNVIDEANLKISNSPQNGFFLKCNTGVSGGLTWSEVTLPTANTLTGSTLASGITATSITSLGTLTGLTVDGTVDINDTITLNSKNEDPSHDRGVIIIQPSASGGKTGINFRSNVNSTSDHGYLWWYDDNDSYNINSSANGENGALVLGVQNDASNSTPGDIVAVESSGNIFLNPGLNDNSYGGASGPDFGRGKVYIGRASSKYQVWHEGNDGSGSGLDADKLDNQEGTYYRNAGNLNAGTVPDARLSSSSLFVTGMIIIWKGAQNQIPTGWVICDGNNNTPDLRNRFIIGAGSGGSYSPNNTGGSSSILLGTANLPAHTHQLGGNVGNANLSHSHSWSGNTNNQGSHSHEITDRSSQDSGDGFQGYQEGSGGSGSNNVNSSTSGGHTHSVSGNTNSQLGNHNHSLPTTTGNQGGSMGQSFNILPPYYALCYIMKT